MLKNEEQVVSFLNLKMSDAVMFRKKHEGMFFGVELEFEGKGVAMEGVPSKNWARHEDNSLRGESIEYTFTQPCDYDEAVSRVNRLFEMIKKQKVNLKNSYRTSTHVHLNFCDKSVKQMINFFLIHTILEQILENYCGDTRRGNLHCISARDNEDIVNMLDDSIFKQYNFNNFNDQVRYCAANLAAINKFGTIEIRTMRGADNAEIVLEWLDILNQLYVFACKDCPPPWRLVENLSYLGSEGFLKQFFREDTVKKLLKPWPAVMDVRQSLMDGVRLVQMLAYKLEQPWTAEFKKVKIAPRDPRFQDKLQHDLIQLVDGRQWFVRPRAETMNGTILHDNLEYTYDGIMWRNGDHLAAKWISIDGHNIVPGSYEDVMEINYDWYEENDADAIHEFEREDEDEG